MRELNSIYDYLHFIDEKVDTFRKFVTQNDLSQRWSYDSNPSILIPETRTPNH